MAGISVQKIKSIGEKHEQGFQHKLTFSCFLWPGHAHPLPFQPRSITELLLRKQTKSRQSVNDTERETQVQALVCPTHTLSMPDGRPLSDMQPHNSIL
ncbi:hypothetical protein NQZ68_008355 [Dissostichus eleginoides]|nr:hypothetical protein NQZ68_008355 [Dissostichus eleginoides]